MVVRMPGKPKAEAQPSTHAERAAAQASDPAVLRSALLDNDHRISALRKALPYDLRHLATPEVLDSRQGQVLTVAQRVRPLPVRSCPS